MLGIALSAFLLFSLELLAGRLLLPVFGGSPAVWTTALVFFTAVLLAGYAYAHQVATRLSSRAGAVLQIVLVGLAVLLTATAPSEPASTRLQDTAETANVLFALALLVGPAALLLATTTPLVSAWYAGSGRNPWWLYAVSNAASFVGLISYPFVIQPLIGLNAQRGLLLLGLAVYGGFVAWMLASLRRREDRGLQPAQAASGDHGTPRLRRQAIWLLTAAVPAGLLSATTNFVQTDLVSAPLIWIGPLGVYLASFVVAFSTLGRLIVTWSERLAPAAAALLWVPFILPVGWPVIPLLLTELGSLFVLATAIHGGLYLDRPDERQLTRFYLILAAGGVVGTAAVALVAPLLFPTVYEYPLLVVAALVALAVLPRRALDAPPIGRRVPALRSLAARLAPYAAVATLLALWMTGDHSPAAIAGASLLLLGGAVVALSTTRALGALAAGVMIGLLVGVTSTAPEHRERTFFGVLEVRATDVARTLYSGTTVHGHQFLDFRRTEPTTYYSRRGPLGDVFGSVRSRLGEARVAVVGLGAGTIAAYAEPGDDLLFIEIDAAVERIAADPAFFTYLRDASVSPRVVIGDGRLELERMPARTFDLIVLDAFTSDAVPAHLLTREALASYQRNLRPGGIIALHLSNRYYDLAPVAAATAHEIGLSALERADEQPPSSDASLAALASRWVVVGQPSDLLPFEAFGWTPPATGFVLTDDYSDLTRILLFSGR